MLVLLLIVVVVLLAVIASVMLFGAEKAKGALLWIAAGCSLTFACVLAGYATGLNYGVLYGLLAAAAILAVLRIKITQA